LRGRLLLVSATLDDGFSPANILVVWKDGPENFRRLFLVNLVDCVITIDRIQEQEQAPNRRIQGIPLRYFGDIPIYTTAIDKTGITATKLLNKVRLSIISVVEGSAQGIRANITVRQDRGSQSVIGGFDPLWSESLVCQFRPLQNEG
jgi:hypothetical protein